MVRRARLSLVLGALVALAMSGPRAQASGDGETEPWYVDQYGGDPPDVNAWLDGRLGIVMPTAPRPMRFVDWRLLHGLKVGRAAGAGLTQPCCSKPWWMRSSHTGASGWREARKDLAGLPDDGYLTGDRPGPDGSSLPNCLDDAFDTAAATLKDRARRYGARSPAVLAWVKAQDAVFLGCGAYNVDLPEPMANAPAWLIRDRAYQQAALALYDQRWDDAAVGFEAIAADPASPWRASGRYLAARALMRQALATKAFDDYAKARSVIGVLAGAPEAVGRDQVPGMLDALDFSQRPLALLDRQARELAAPAPERLAVIFRDYSEIGETAAKKPEALDWIDTVRALPSDLPYSDQETVAQAVRRFEAARTTALAHAVEHWRSGRDVAWLAAAISLADADDPQAPDLLRAAGQVPANSPAYVDLQHHLVRLTLARTPAADMRRRLDAILARRDLSLSDRNVFTAERAQVSSDLADFLRFALRRRLCATAPLAGADEAPRCTRQGWLEDDVQPRGVYDGAYGRGAVGFGEDARALIDRAPLAERIALSRAPVLPARLRLDIAMTSYARAVQLQDNAAIDALARELQGLLPLMATEFRAIPAARPGPDKRFAEFLVLAKIPGVRVDLVDYRRPEGRRIADFQQYWTDWVILRRPATGVSAPRQVQYQTAGTNFAENHWYDWPDANSDLTCLGECGRGAAPLRTPDFLASQAAKAASERSWFFKSAQGYETVDPPASTAPPDAVHAWDEMLAYAAAHPRDPRIPETLYWLIEVGHYGGSHEHSGRRAFLLLHHRYPGSAWAKKAKYYND